MRRSHKRLPLWGAILYSGMALAAASTPNVRPVGRTSSCGGSAWVRGKLCMAVGRRTCPSRQSRKRSTSWSSSVSGYMSSTQAPSRLKQIDRRSCTGNVNSPKLGGLPAHPLRNTRSRPATRVWVCRGSDALQADVLTVPSRCARRATPRVSPFGALSPGFSFQVRPGEYEDPVAPIG